MWIESGLAWLPYLMQRLDSEYMMRSSEAPLLKRKPSEYIKEMYFSSQPMESNNLKLLEGTMEAINAETQLLWCSDWPHWDFDSPSVIWDLPFLNERQKRNILGENAARLFGLDNPYGGARGGRIADCAVRFRSMTTAREVAFDHLGLARPCGQRYSFCRNNVFGGQTR